MLSKEDPDLRFVLVGDGSDAYKCDLHHQARELRLDTKLIWAGAGSHMPDIYSALDVVVSCSISEGFPNVIAEAMACQVPCVVTDVGDSAWIVGDTGVVIPPNSVDELVGGIKALLALNTADTNSQSASVRRRIEQHFSLQMLCEHTERVLQDLMV